MDRKGESLTKDEMEPVVYRNKNREIAIIVVSGFVTLEDKVDIKC